jgi:hypothetical protein
MKKAPVLYRGARAQDYLLFIQRHPARLPACDAMERVPGYISFARFLVGTEEIICPRWVAP